MVVRDQKRRTLISALCKIAESLEIKVKACLELEKSLLPSLSYRLTRNAKLNHQIKQHSVNYHEVKTQLFEVLVVLVFVGVVVVLVLFVVVVVYVVVVLYFRN